MDPPAHGTKRAPADDECAACVGALKRARAQDVRQALFVAAADGDTERVALLLPPGTRSGAAVRSVQWHTAAAIAAHAGHAHTTWFLCAWGAAHDAHDAAFVEHVCVVLEELVGGMRRAADIDTAPWESDNREHVYAPPADARGGAFPSLHAIVAPAWAALVAAPCAIAGWLAPPPQPRIELAAALLGGGLPLQRIWLYTRWTHAWWAALASPPHGATPAAAAAVLRAYIVDDGANPAHNKHIAAAAAMSTRARNHGHGWSTQQRAFTALLEYALPPSRPEFVAAACRDLPGGVCEDDVRELQQANAEWAARARTATLADRAAWAVHWQCAWGPHADAARATVLACATPAMLAGSFRYVQRGAEGGVV